MEIANLIQLATDNGALGIAFDFYFTESSEVDSVLCDVAKKANLDVVIGYSVRDVAGELRPTPTAPALNGCFPGDRRGHLVGLLEPDQRVRLIPLWFRDKSEPALSLRIAESLAASQGIELALPKDERLRFIEPANPRGPRDAIPQVSFQKLRDEEESRKLLNGAFVLVGAMSQNDTFSTPFGKIPGVLIHAYAVHSLRANHYLTRTPWWSGALVILLSCYLIAVWAANKAPARRIILGALLLSAVIVGASVAAAAFWLVWLDIVYALTAIGLLVILLLVFRRLIASQPEPSMRKASEKRS